MKKIATPKQINLKKEMEMWERASKVDLLNFEKSINNSRHEFAMGKGKLLQSLKDLC